LFLGLVPNWPCKNLENCCMTANQNFCRIEWGH
jgi:hypothetical protein